MRRNGAIGVELAGYLEAAVGVGEHARRYAEALVLAGVHVRARTVPLPGRDPARSPVAQRHSLWTGTRFNLLCLNPEQLVPYLASRDAPRLRGRTSIGVWTWEVDVLPDGWREAAQPLAEIWTNSRFAAQLIVDGTGARVRAYPPPLSPAMLSQPPARERAPGQFTVLVMFDYLSTLERKNPLAAIAAYRAAFEPDDGARLIVKSLNGVHRPDRCAALETASSARPDIVLRDGAISERERDQLIASADCLLSLHRSEGLGLHLAEAMAAGKPVVATGYGGNLEFMTSENSYLVPYERALVGPDCEHYPAGASWAEPDTAAAAAMLREIFEDPRAAADRARRGQRDVVSILDPQRVGEAMRSRLVDLSR